MKAQRSLKFITAATLLALIASGCGSTTTAGPVKTGAARPTQNASLVLDWYPNSDHGGLFTAISKGIFRQHHIRMSAYVPSDTSAQIKLVAAGRTDFGISYETDLLAARARGIPVRSVMCIMQHPLDTVMALKSSGITQPHQLAGRTIGTAGVPSDIAMVTAMMAYNHSSVHKAHLVSVGYNLLPALLGGRADAIVGGYWNWEAIQAALKGHPVNVMRVERWGVPNFCELVLITHEQTIHSRPAFVRDVVVAMQKGYAYAEAHPTSAWQALHAQDKTLDRTLVMKSLMLLKPVVTDAPTMGYQDPAQWRAYAAWLWANRLIAKPVKASQAFTNQFLQSGIR